MPKKPVTADDLMAWRVMVDKDLARTSKQWPAKDYIHMADRLLDHMGYPRGEG